MEEGVFLTEASREVCLAVWGGGGAGKSSMKQDSWGREQLESRKELELRKGYQEFRKRGKNVLESGNQAVRGTELLGQVTSEAPSNCEFLGS